MEIFAKIFVGLIVFDLIFLALWVGLVTIGEKRQGRRLNRAITSEDGAIARARAMLS